jgi:hypothetical protein
MKNVLIIILAVGLAALGALYYNHSRQNAQKEAQLAAIQAEAEAKAQQLAEAEAARARADHQQEQLLRLTEQMGAELKAQQAARTNTMGGAEAEAASRADTATGADKKGGFGQMLASMMNDPDVKKMIQEQQRAMIEPLYGPLIKKMNLSPEEADAFKKLLSDHMMKSAEQATSLFAGGSSTNRQELVAGLTAQQKAFDEEVKAMLGETRYEQYKDYQQTMGERAQLNVFRQQNAMSGTPLTDGQTEQLLALMNEEKKRAAAEGAPQLDSSGQGAANLEAMLSEDKTRELLESQERVNQRVYQRASEVLGPDQLEAFGRFQTNQLQMMKMGMSMARKLMAPDQTSPADQAR